MYNREFPFGSCFDTCLKSGNGVYNPNFTATYTKNGAAAATTYVFHTPMTISLNNGCLKSNYFYVILNGTAPPTNTQCKNIGCDVSTVPPSSTSGISIQICHYSGKYIVLKIGGPNFDLNNTTSITLKNIDIELEWDAGGGIVYISYMNDLSFSGTGICQHMTNIKHQYCPIIPATNIVTL